MKDRIEEIKTIFKYLLSAGTSFLIDVLAFALFEALLLGRIGDEGILASTVCARVISSAYNYFVNSRLVFKKYDRKSVYKYYALVVIQMLISAASVYGLNVYFAGINDVFIKIPVEMVIFVVNYIVQKKWVFVSDGRDL